jgi:rhodanese-related sulfurtransferase
MSTIQPLSPAELARRLEQDADLVLLDVREPRELALCRLAGSISIPLGELERRQAELDPARPIVCICHHGIRSAHAAGRLASAGFQEIYNLSGGLDRWSLEVDPGLRRY